MLRPLIQPRLKQVLAQSVSPSLSVLAAGGPRSFGMLDYPQSVVIIGDSFAATDKPELSAVDMYVPSNSHFMWANAYAGNRLWAKGDSGDSLAGYQGVGGYTTANVLAAIGSATALNPSHIYCHVGINDIVTDIPSSTSISNYEQIVNAIRSAGARPILVTLPPTTSINSSARQTAFNELNAWIRSQGTASIICEQTDAYIDYAAPYSWPKAGYTIDGVHTNQKGAERAGNMMSSGMLALLSAVDNFSAHSEIFTNQYMLGIGGVVAEAVTGVAPDNMTIGNPATTDYGGPASKVVRSGGEGEGEWSLVKAVGPTTYASFVSEYVQLQYTVNLPIGSINAGDLYQCVVEMKDINVSNFKGAEVRWRSVGATRQWWYMCRITSAADLNAAVEGDLPWRIMATPVLPAEAGVTSFNLYVRAIAEAANGAVDIFRGRHAIIRYPAYT